MSLYLGNRLATAQFSLLRNEVQSATFHAIALCFGRFGRYAVRTSPSVDTLGLTPTITFSQPAPQALPTARRRDNSRREADSLAARRLEMPQLKGDADERFLVHRVNVDDQWTRFDHQPRHRL